MTGLNLSISADDLLSDFQKSPTGQALIEARTTSWLEERRAHAKTIQRATAERVSTAKKRRADIATAKATEDRLRQQYEGAVAERLQLERALQGTMWKLDRTVRDAEHALRRSAEPRIAEFLRALREMVDLDCRMQIERVDQSWRDMSGFYHGREVNSCENLKAHLQLMFNLRDSIEAWQLEVLTPNELTARIAAARQDVERSRERARQVGDEVKFVVGQSDRR